MPGQVVWGETHGVAVDRAGLIYVKHRSTAAEPMDSIVVFDPEGKYIRSFGKEYHGGGHGIDIRTEGNDEFLYLCDVKNRLVAKATLAGEQLWKMHFPEQAGVYKDLKEFNPTNVAFAPDGGFYVWARVASLPAPLNDGDAFFDLQMRRAAQILVSGP